MDEELRNMLLDIIQRLERIEREVERVSKHVPFVDDLANSGVVKAVSFINHAVSSLNPMRMRDDEFLSITQSNETAS